MYILKKYFLQRIRASQPSFRVGTAGRNSGGRNKDGRNSGGRTSEPSPCTMTHGPIVLNLQLQLCNLCKLLSLLNADHHPSTD
jgi:hypothetical protein